MKLEALEKDSVYHLYNRGINRTDIFSNEENKWYFLKQYNKYLSGKVSTFAYCLLKNYFHFVVRIEGETKEVIQCFSNFFNSYAKAFNKKENRSGSLFEKHFKRIKVDNEDYLKQLIIYVNLNPQIHFGEDFKDYSFSSYKEISSGSSKIVKSDEIFELFGGKKNFEEVHEIRKISLCEQLTLEKNYIMIKNDLFLRALKGETVDRPPVWMMRQAGRYLPDFMKLKEKYDFFTRCRTPELATEITVMPIHQVGTDAAILFSDILVVPQAMNIEVEMKPGVGPWLPNPVRTSADVEKVIIPDVHESLGYVLEAIKMTKKELNDEVPLIGFAGSPWTILCYAVQGQGSKNFDIAKKFCFTNPQAAHTLLQKITETTIEYLKAKVEAGVDAVQIFDSWGGMLSPQDYQEFSWKYIQQIIDALKGETPVIAFGKGCWFALDKMAVSGASAIGVDWTCSPSMARNLTGGEITLQGNFDPSRLYSPPSKIKEMVHNMISEFGKDRYVVNLGHGILPDIPVENAIAFVEAVKEYKGK